METPVYMLIQPPVEQLASKMRNMRCVKTQNAYREKCIKGYWQHLTDIILRSSPRTINMKVSFQTF